MKNRISDITKARTCVREWINEHGHVRDTPPTHPTCCGEVVDLTAKKADGTTIQALVAAGRYRLDNWRMRVRLKFYHATEETFFGKAARDIWRRWTSYAWNKNKVKGEQLDLAL